MITLKKKCTLYFVVQVFKGYVDDPRNTDNAWMETVAVNFHDENGTHSLKNAVFYHFITNLKDT